ncbi:MAG: hypothetical protein QM499_11965 [Flavobacteriaceae bacterium]
MNRIIYTLIIGIIFLGSCRDEKKSEILLDHTIVTDCLGKPLKLYLPKGFGIPDRVEDYTGFFQTYIYSDKSCLTIMCDSTSELGISKAIKENVFAREEKFNGFSMIYWNVKAERKAEFDLAFEKMKTK